MIVDGGGDWSYKIPMGLVIKETAAGVSFSVKVVPGGSRTGVAGLYGQALKINLAAPAEKGKANRQLIRLLAELLHRPRRDLSLAGGAGSARKEIHVADMTEGQLRQNLAEYLK